MLLYLYKHELTKKSKKGCYHLIVSRNLFVRHFVSMNRYFFISEEHFMIIKRILNNNAVITTNDKGIEVLVMGRGISFGKKSGQKIEVEKIEKSFLLKNKENMNRFTELFIDVPMEIVYVSEKIINTGKIKLGNNFDEIIYINLTDHIYSAIKRRKEGQLIPNLLIWEVSKYYSEEYALGLKALDIIKTDLGIVLDENEATSIALHFVSANLSNNFQETYDIIDIISHIEEIVKDYFKTEFDQNSIDYYRFITHIKLFAYRLKDREFYNDDDDDLLLLMKSKYPKEYKCSQLIANYILTNFSYQPSSSELVYLTAHIRRLTKNLQ